MAGMDEVQVVVSHSQRATLRAELHEVILDEADGLDWATLCKCDLIYAVPSSQLSERRGTVTMERRRQIAQRAIRALGFAGL